MAALLPISQFLLMVNQFTVKNENDLFSYSELIHHQNHTNPHASIAEPTLIYEKQPMYFGGTNDAEPKLPLGGE